LRNSTVSFKFTKDGLLIVAKVMKILEFYPKFAVMLHV